MELEFGVFGSGQETTALADAETLRRIAGTAEDLGYASLWAGDHLAFENPILESLIALSFFAGCTQSITLGTAVYLLPLRPPALAAKQVSSLEVLAPGRLILGIGVGGEGKKDFEAVQVAIEERGARTDEALGVMRSLFLEREASFEGTFTRFQEVTMEPRPSQRIPIWVGGRSDAALERVVQHADGWLALFQSPEGFQRSVASIEARCRAAGRDPAAITPALVLPAVLGADDDMAAEALTEHLSVRYGRPFERRVVDRYGLAGSPQRCVERIQQYIDAGVRHFVINPAVPPQEREEFMHQFDKQVISAFGH